MMNTRVHSQEKMPNSSGAGCCVDSKQLLRLGIYGIFGTCLHCLVCFQIREENLELSTQGLHFSPTLLSSAVTSIRRQNSDAAYEHKPAKKAYRTLHIVPALLFQWELEGSLALLVVITHKRHTLSCSVPALLFLLLRASGDWTVYSSMCPNPQECPDHSSPCVCTPLSSVMD